MNTSSPLISSAGLHKHPSVFDRRETQLAYEAAYYPASCLNSFHKVVWQKTIVMSKQAILSRCNEDKTLLGTVMKSGLLEEFPIHWIYNNVPTESEWSRLHSMAPILVNFRLSPLLATSNNRIALLQHYSPYNKQKD